MERRKTHPVRRSPVPPAKRFRRHRQPARVRRRRDDDRENVPDGENPIDDSKVFRDTAIDGAVRDRRSGGVVRDDASELVFGKTHGGYFQARARHQRRIQPSERHGDRLGARDARDARSRGRARTRASRERREVHGQMQVAKKRGREVRETDE